MINVNISKELFSSSGKIDLDINLSIESGSFIALTGESGSGKTTLLRILAGLDEAKGSIKVSNRVWLDESYFLPPQQREIGFLFQDYALFPNMTVVEQLLFVKKDQELASHLLDVTGLIELKDRYPNSLSGGQKQRVSLSRALMRRPKLLLLDEPLSALDSKMRTYLQKEIVQLHRELKTTTILVSHDNSEIYKMADRVLVLESGKIIEDGTPDEVFFQNRDRDNIVGEVVSLEKSLVVISVCGQLLKVPTSSIGNSNFKIGSTVNLKV
jgi:molybdate transport system ATP-binding protein